MARLSVNPGDIGAEIPDQPYGGNAPDISSNDNPQRDAIAQALMNQQQQSLMAPPAGGPGPEAAYYDLMRQRGSNPNAIGQQAALLGNAPPSMAPPRPDQSSQTQNPLWAQLRGQLSPADLQAFSQRVSPSEFQAFMNSGGGNSGAGLFAPKGQPSGSVTDVGWMNALQPWQGGVSVGGQPGTPPSGGTPWTGGGSMAAPSMDYWSRQGGGGYGGGGSTGGLTTDDYNILLSRVGPDAMKSWIEGGGLSGTPGYGGMAGGMAGGVAGGTPSYGAGPSNPTGQHGITDQEMGRAVRGVNTERGVVNWGDVNPLDDPNNPQNQVGINPYGYNFSPAYNYTSLYGQPTNQPSFTQQQMDTAKASIAAGKGWSIATPVGQDQMTINQMQALQDAADDAEADAGDDE